MMWELIVVFALVLPVKAQLDTDIALYILYGILAVSALVCLILIICIVWFCRKVWQLRVERMRECSDVDDTGRSKNRTSKSLRLLAGQSRNVVAAESDNSVQLKHLLSITSDTSEGVSTPQYDATSTFKPVTEDKVAMEGDEGTAETKFNATSSKPSLTSATAVEVVVTETQEEFQARKEEAKMLRQKSQEHPPNPCSLLRDERETKYTGLSRRDSLSYHDLPGVCAEKAIYHSKSEGHLDSQPAESKENSLSEDDKRAQFASQRDSAKKNRQGKRVVEARDSTQPLLLSTPSESELPEQEYK